MKNGLAISYVTSLMLVVFLLQYKSVCAEDSLILAVHPYLSHEELDKRFTPIANYLGKQIGQNIKVRVGSSYEEHILFVGTDKVDLAFIGPVPYVHMLSRFGNKPLLAKLEVNGSPFYQGHIVTRKDSGLNALQDLKGKRIAFGDPYSTMSYVVPHYMLHQANVFTDLSPNHLFLDGHNDVALGVLTGDFDAGAVRSSVFNQFEEKGLKTVAITPKISTHLFITRTKLPARLVQDLRKVMLNIKNSAEGMVALHAINKGITGLVGVKNNDYEELEKYVLETEYVH